ncbi:hypothetical protein [Halorubrum sp. DTA98]|uniref:hypothetical protein n=1 Tax=Halorubrum sp. DTA98 TaxID=3402163 RepID=UPI003AACBB51
MTQILVPGDHEDLSPYYETWDEGTYTDVDDAFIQHVESGVLHHVITPVGDLVEKSFSGIIPRMVITQPDDSVNGPAEAEE